MADNAVLDLTQAAEQMKGMLNDPLATPAEEPKKEPEEQAQAVEQEIEETQEATEAPEAEAVEETAETKEDATEEGAEQGAEEVELGANEFAGLLGLNEDKIHIDDAGAISFKTEVDGVETNVNLDELINAHQGNANLTNRSKAIAELEKQRTSEIQAFQAQATQQAQQSAITLEAINNAYLTEFNSVDWVGLKAEDPALWSAKTVEMQQKKTELDNLVSTTIAEVQKQQQVVDEESAKIQQQHLVSEQSKMQDAFKSLNVKVDNDLQNDVISYLTGQFDESEMQGLVDHRHMINAYKAMQFDKGRTKAESKKVKKLPKVLKAGRKPTKQAVQLNEDKKLTDNLKKSGSLDDAAAVLRKRLRQE